MKKFILTAAILISLNVYASELDDIELAPEGAHAKQMLLMGFVSLGLPFGSITDSENKFISNSTHYFISSDTTKMIDLTHLATYFGISFEYMPIDYLGLKVRLRKDSVVQRTRFGSDYKNWSETLFSGYSINFGIPLHLTVRKRWDVSLIPYIGYYTADVYPVPVGSKIIEGYTGPESQSVSGTQYGAELVFIYYFSGGFTLSGGLEWTLTSIALPEKVSSLNPQTNTEYTASTDMSYHNVSLLISAGYAFSN